MGDLLQVISEDNQILAPGESRSVDFLRESLRKSPASTGVYGFLDKCILNVVRKSVIYYEQVHGDCNSASKPENFGKATVDLLSAAIADQWPFLVKASTLEVASSVATWIVQFLNLSMHAGRDHHYLVSIRDQMIQSIEDQAIRSTLGQALRAPFSPFSKLQNQSKSRKEDVLCEDRCYSRDYEAADVITGSEEAFFSGVEPLREREEHRVLSRWVHEGIPEIVLNGTIGEIAICLCSTLEEVRKQAFGALRKIGALLKVCYPYPFGTIDGE